MRTQLHSTDILREPIAEAGLRPVFFNITDYLFPEAEKKSDDMVSAELLMKGTDAMKITSRIQREFPRANMEFLVDRGTGRQSTGYAIVEILAARSVVNRLQAEFERLTAVRPRNATA